jgi:hypothetical protein
LTIDKCRAKIGVDLPFPFSEKGNLINIWFGYFKLSERKDDMFRHMGNFIVEKSALREV